MAYSVQNRCALSLRAQQVNQPHLNADEQFELISLVVKQVARTHSCDCRHWHEFHPHHHQTYQKMPKRAVRMPA